MLVLAGLLAVGVRLVDTPAVRAAIQGRLAAALGGRIVWDSLEVRLLPAPHGELRGVRIEIPGAFSARAERLQAYLRLLPLLRGRPEIASLSVSGPELRIELAPGAGGQEQPLDPLDAYRKAMRAVAQALQAFAPDTEFAVAGASIDVAALELRELNIKARTRREGLVFDADSAGNFWKRLRLRGTVNYDDLSAGAEAEAEAEHFESAKATLTIPASGDPSASAELKGVDLAAVLALARPRLGGLGAIRSVHGRLSAKLEATLAKDWRAALQVEKSDAMVQLAALPWPIALSAGSLSASAQAIELRGAAGAVGASRYADVSARLELGKPLRLAAASGRATLQLEQLFPWLKERLPLDEVQALAGGAEVAVRKLALRFDRPAEADFEVAAEPRQLSVALKALPAPLAASGGSVIATPTQVRFDKLAVALLDAKAELSGSYALREGALEAAIAQGSAGEKLVHWTVERAGAPASVEPKTPLRFSARRLAWRPGGALELDAQFDLDNGPQLAVRLASRPGDLDLQRVAVKDATSDAAISARVGDKLMQASFSGRLQGRSVAALLRQPPPSDSGAARGDLRITVDRARPERTQAEGRLSIEDLDLTWLLARKVRILSAEITAQPTGLRVAKARFDWEEQPFDLRAEVWRTATGPTIDARIESPGVVIDRLLPPGKPAEKPPAPGGPSKLWPLPVTGTVEVRAGFVQFGEHRIAPFEGQLGLERERARLDVKQARMCGLSFPLLFEATPQAFAASGKLSMRDEPLEAAARCLTGGGIEISGGADLSAELRTQGKSREELVRNLSGAVQAEVRKGRVKKFALIGNILSLRDIASLREPREEGFAYRSLSARGQFANGEFLLDEGFFDSDAARLAANGRIDLISGEARLNVLVGLLTTVDRVTGAVPIIGDVFGGTLTALPVSVSGNIRDPIVVPLGPRAVTDRLLGIFERTLKLPGKLVVPPAAKEPAAQPR